VLQRARAWRPTPDAVRRLALASVVANVGIVITGGGVRLTGSGLGCPTWPSCTDSSYVPTAEMGGHGLIEFGNRMLSFAVTVVTIALLVAARRAAQRRPDLVRLSTLGFLGIPAQALLGGITVLTKLNPWTVAAHFLLSMALIWLAVVTWQRSREGDLPARLVTPRALQQAAYALLGLVALVLALGTVVTGSGPHSGDQDTGRTGFDPEVVSQVHADLVFVLVGATIALVFAYRATGSAAAARAALVLLGVELSQGVVGFVQYWTDLPEALVAIHMAGACVTVVAAARVHLATRERGPVSPGVPVRPAPAGQPSPVPAGA
jgi:cytochrome c oxidase assembly protein subunit 15